MKYETYVLQDKQELGAFIALLKAENVKSYLEIGCKFGGSLWPIAQSLPRGSRVVAVDLPHGDTSFKDTEPHLRQCVDALRQKGYDAQLIIGDSTDPEVVDAVRLLGPYDAVFIDANHTVEYVKKDFANYSPMTKLIAMHDINFFRPGGLPPHKKPIEVPEVWKEIKEGRRFIEIIKGVPNSVGCRDNGIGVIWV